MERLYKLTQLEIFYGNPVINFNSGILLFSDKIFKNRYNLALISIPSEQDIHEILSVFNNDIKKSYLLKIFKTEISKYYTVIFYFNNKEDILYFYNNYNNKKITFFEDNIMIFKFIKKIKFNNEAIDNIENEKCTICLEYLNKGGTVIMILCGHYFHNKCLKRWNDESCPLCRYEQYPININYCEMCNNSDNIYMCIICGFFGCAIGDIPNEGHIADHASDTNHIFSKLVIVLLQEYK